MENEQFADRASRLIKCRSAPWLPVGDLLSSLSIWLIRKRFPSLRKLRSSRNLVKPPCGQINTVEAEGVSAQAPGARRSEPLISGSGAIMLWKNPSSNVLCVFQDYCTKVSRVTGWSCPVEMFPFASKMPAKPAPRGFAGAGGNSRWKERRRSVEGFDFQAQAGVVASLGRVATHEAVLVGLVLFADAAQGDPLPSCR